MKLGRFELNDVYLEDSYKAIKEIPDKSIDLIITDPPYEIEGIHGSGVMKESYKNPECYMNQIGDNNLHKGIDYSILDELVRVMKKINIYIWCNKTQIPDYLDFFLKKHKCNWELLIWEKSNVPPFCGTHYLVDKEYCLYFWEEGANVYIPYERAKTIFHGKTNVADKKEFGHPTIKDYEMTKVMIKNSTSACRERERERENGNCA